MRFVVPHVGRRSPATWLTPQARSCPPSVFRGRPCARWRSRSRSERSRARAAALAPPWRVVVLLAWWEGTILVSYTRARMAARSASEMNPGNSGRPHPSRKGEWQEQLFFVFFSRLLYLTKNFDVVCIFSSRSVFFVFCAMARSGLGQK